MEESAKQKLVEQFASLTGADQQRATFFLESANWNFELAVQSFFEGEEQDEDFLIEPIVEPKSPSDRSVEMADSGSDIPPQVPKDTNNNQRPARSDGSNIATLSSLRESDRIPENQQAFYTGGSEHSGQQVLGPDSKKSNPERIISDLFTQAKKNAEVLSHVPQKESQASTSRAFTGTGFTLGSTSDDSRQVVGSSGRSRAVRHEEQSLSSSDDEEEVTVLKLWQDGFSLDDGPLRSYDDPHNQELLAAVRRGERPAELIKGRSGSRPVILSMQDHRGEKYTPPPKKPTKAFTGDGHRLGTPANELINQAAPAVGPVDAASAEAALANANSFLGFNPAEPNTRIQIRLADGSRLVVQINLAKLVSDLRQYICIARPEYSAIPFSLMTTFPNKVIDNESATIAESGLANSSLVQRLI